MALFPIVESDNDIQINDKLRIRGVESFVSQGSSAITTMTVQPEDSEAAIDIFNSDQRSRYLDWAYTSFVGDFDSSNNKLDFSETSGVDLLATITPGSYALSALVSEVETQLNASGAGTYTLTLDARNRITISSTVSFDLKSVTGENVDSSILPILGFKLDTNTVKSVEGTPFEYMPKKVTLEIGDGVSTSSINTMVNMYSVDGDRLFSNDGDLKPLENKIMKWLPSDRSSFTYQHRESQRQIINYLDRNGFVNVYNEKYTKFDIIDFEEVRDWSKWLALKLIYKDQNESIGDVFEDKAKYAESKEVESRNRAVLRLDVNKDGKADTGEELKLQSIDLFRR